MVGRVFVLLFHALWLMQKLVTPVKRSDTKVKSILICRPSIFALQPYTRSQWILISSLWSRDLNQSKAFISTFPFLYPYYKTVSQPSQSWAYFWSSPLSLSRTSNESKIGTWLILPSINFSFFSLQPSSGIFQAVWFWRHVYLFLE